MDPAKHHLTHIPVPAPTLVQAQAGLTVRSTKPDRKAGETSLSIGVGKTSRCVERTDLEKRRKQNEMRKRRGLHVHLICQRCALCVMTSSLDPIVVQIPSRPE